MQVGDLKIDPAPAELITAKTAMEEVLGHAQIDFEHQALAGHRFQSDLVGSAMSHAQARTSYNVLPFGTVNGHRYWIGVRLQFGTKLAEAWFESASVLVFKGPFTDDRKRPVLRAEWERVENPPGDHAQPHWHIYSPQEAHAATSPEDLGSQQWQTFSDESMAGRSSSLLPVARFHFAMAASWHRDEQDAHYVEPSAECIGDWLRGCCRYVQGQLEYITRMLPTGSDT